MPVCTCRIISLVAAIKEKKESVYVFEAVRRGRGVRSITQEQQTRRIKCLYVEDLSHGPVACTLSFSL